MEKAPGKSSKHQHPSSREAPTSKLQFYSHAAIGVWGLEFLWSLELGVWMFSCGHEQLHGFQFTERTFQIFRDNRGHVRAALAAGVAPGLLQLREIFRVLSGDAGIN